MKKCDVSLFEWNSSLAMLIVFLGVDGSGKSTVINSFVNHISNEWSEIKYVHFRPTYLLRGNANDKPVTNPHEGKSRGLIMSLLKLLLFAIEYNYAFYVHYRKPDQLVVFDRYYYDILADPKRAKVSAPNWVVKIFERLIPTPDITFYLHASADVLYGRKQEIARDDLENILRNYSSMADTYNFYKISSETSIQVTLSEILSIYKDAKSDLG